MIFNLSDNRLQDIAITVYIFPVRPLSSNPLTD